MSDFDPISGQKYLTYSAGALNAAVAAERERCAKIAEEVAVNVNNYKMLCDEAGMLIADKIRSGK
jgi:hypothetical protein